MIERVSRRALSGTSGTYHVRASELATLHDKKPVKTFTVTIHFLDGTQQDFSIEKRAKGKALLEKVNDHLELVESDYFGLRYYVCRSGKNEPRWLETDKSIRKQLGDALHLYFQVKFYVSDPSKLFEEFTRYQFYLQLRQDIKNKKLVLSPSSACLLASYIVQCEVGDYQPDEHGENYLSELSLIPDQNEDIERKICELHKLHKGQSPADAEFNFLDHAKRLELYGVDFHHGQDSNGKDLQLGVAAAGLLIYRNKIRINTFSWASITKISFKKSQFLIHLRREPTESYEAVVVFNLFNTRYAKTLWKASVEHHAFFRCSAPPVYRTRRFPSFRLGSRFRYSGRTESQTIENGKQFLHRLTSNGGGTPNGKRKPFSRRSIGGKTVIVSAASVNNTGSNTQNEDTKPKLSLASWGENKVQSLDNWEPRQAWTQEDDTSSPSPLPHVRILDDDGGFAEERTAEELAFSPATASILGYVDDDSNEIYDTPPYSPPHSPVPSLALLPSNTIDGLVSVRLLPDDQGRFGFNVRGGAENNMPITISRVAPNTPADRCMPRLKVGDHLIVINGQDVTHANNQSVVETIRGADHLYLTLRQCSNIPMSLSANEEPVMRYVPENPQILGAIHDDDNILNQSMLFLADGLASGSLISRYDQLYKKNPDLNTNECRRPENIDKNRYRDISPYDDTRVILTNGLNEGDYINANYVNMQITGTDIVNHYIATQGPLASTTDDFWQMVHQCKSKLIIMLTTLMERGRNKCYKYWPSLDESITLRNLKVTCKSEAIDVTESFATRQFVLRDDAKGEEESVTHMQYLAWPDHGVPEDSQCFLNFMEDVRKRRGDTSSPIVVHCSAGIGRTGVLILMDTAMCLIEANQPVYPLDIVRTMRDQRPMMIQNASQYKFVSQCIYEAFTSGKVCPHPQ